MSNPLERDSELTEIESESTRDNGREPSTSSNNHQTNSTSSGEIANLRTEGWMQTESVARNQRIVESPLNQQSPTSSRAVLSNAEMKVAHKANPPKTLQDTTTDQIEIFVQGWKNYIKFFKNVNHRILIKDYILPSLWESLHRRYPKVFKNTELTGSVFSDRTEIRNVNATILKYFEEILDLERTEVLWEIRQSITNFSWEEKPGTSLFRNITEHIDKGREHSSLTDDVLCKRAVLIRTIETLPEFLKLSKQMVELGDVKTFEDLTALVKERKYTIYAELEQSTLDRKNKSISVSNVNSSNRVQTFARGMNNVGSFQPSENIITHSVQNTFEQIDPININAYVASELEAQKCGICFACRAEDHSRAECPVKENRNGKPKKFFGPCFNCGTQGHSYRECTYPMKQALQRRLDRLKNRYGNKNQSYNNSNQRFNQNVNFRSNDRSYDRNQNQNFRFNNQSQNQNQHNRNGARSVEALNGSSNMNTNLERVESNDNHLALKVRLIEGEYPKDTVEVCKDGKWIQIDGNADSGCDTTTGSIQQHEKWCVTSWSAIGRKTNVHTAGDTSYPVVREGIMQLRVNGKEIPEPVRVTLVDCPTWPRLLVGRNCMKKYTIISRGYNN